MAYDNGASGIVSTFDNFSDERSGIKVNRGEIRFTGTTGAVQTTVDSALTVVDTFIHNTTNGNTSITGTFTSGLITKSAGMVVSDTTTNGRGIYRNNRGYDLRLGVVLIELLVHI